MNPKIKKYKKEYRLKNKEEIQEYLRLWYIKNKEKHNANCRKYRLKNKDKLKKSYREWAKNNRCKLRINESRYKNKYPWLISLWNAKSHCSSKEHSYYKRGIKFFLTKEQIKYIWFRDNAHLLKNPSIDRIDGKGNYEVSNCRFIELAVNQKRQRR